MPNHIHLLISEPETGDSVDGDASVEAASFEASPREEAARKRETTWTSVSRGKELAEAILAAPISRLQCVERQEESGEAGVYAHESCEAGTGAASSRLAVEQLFVLFG